MMSVRCAWRGLVLAHVVASAAAAATTGAHGPRPGPGWIDGRLTERRFLDLASPDPWVVPAGEVRAFPLPAPFAFRGARYDTLLVGPEPGVARLAWRGSPALEPASDDRHPELAVPPPETTLLMRPLGAGLQPGDASVTQVRSDGASVAVRWVRLEDSWGHPATFDALLSPDGVITFQYLQVPASIRYRPETAGILVEATFPVGTRMEPSSEGFAVEPGAHVVFPPVEPTDEKAGCGIAPDWCSVVDAYDPGCRTNHFPNDATPCGTTEAKRWHFNEGQYCRSCPYTFYVTVECGKEMHLPFLDMEGNQVRIIDVFTGVELELEATNQCAKTPFVYCDRCPGGIDEILTNCPTGPYLDCIPYVQRSTLIQWGAPLADRNGDGVADELPCGPPNTASGCYQSGGNPAFEEQNVDVLLRGQPAVCGVFRLELVAGGFHWYLSANCTGIVPTTPEEIDKNFIIYQNCGDALAAFDPVTELVVVDFEFGGACPDIYLEVEIANIGCVDAPSSPIFIDFDHGGQADISDNLGAVPAGGSVSKRIPVRLQRPSMNATVTVDPGNLIAECTEQPVLSFNGCEPAAGTETITKALCICANTVQAGVFEQRLFSCAGAPVTIDGGPSSAVPCTGGGVEWRFLDAGGGIVQDWSIEPTLQVTPARCPSIETYRVEARCSTETGADCGDAVDVTVECTVAPAIEAVASPVQICEGETVVLTASAGFVGYAWDNGRTGRSFSDTPAATTTYTVEGTDIRGCKASAQATVVVVPDPLPGSIGASLRAAKQGLDVAFTYAEVAGPVSEYELACHEPGEPWPCVRPRPTDPTPARMQAAPAIDAAAPGAPQPALIDVDGVRSCPRLLHNKLRAKSACTFRRGPTCDGEPMQGLPCP